MPGRKALFSQSYWSHRSVDCLPWVVFQRWLHSTGTAFNTFNMFFNTSRVSASIQGYLVLAITNTKLHCGRASQRGCNTSSLNIVKPLLLRKHETLPTRRSRVTKHLSAFSLLFQNFRQVTLVYKFNFFLLQNIKIIPSLLQYKVFYKLEDNCISVSHTGYQK